MKFDRNSDVTKNVKIIEWMKKELILSVGDVFDLIFKGVKPLDEALQDTLANIIMITYLLAKRLGISFSEIDYKIKEKIRIGIDQNHSVESWYGDFSNLKKHMERASVHLAVGSVWVPFCKENVEKYMSEADSKMYENKRDYYNNHNFG